MARVADTETAEAAAAAGNNVECPCVVKLCCVALPLALAVYITVLFVSGIGYLEARYESPEFNLTSLNASQPSALLFGHKVAVVSGWVACFSARNPNLKPISYHEVTALLWAHRGRHDCQFDQADVAAFKQEPAVAGLVCAGFPGDAMMMIEGDDVKTVWFDAVRLKANITYQSDESSLHVVCKDVKVVVDGNESAVVTELLGGPKECRVKRKSETVGLIIAYLVFEVILIIGVMVGFGQCGRRCFFNKT